MSIVQILPTVSYGDAVSNDAVAIAKVIEDMGYKTGIYAENVDARLSYPFIHNFEKLPRLKDRDIVIFNHSTGTELCYKLPELKGRKMMIYHNITPPRFFDNYSISARDLTRYGYEGTKYLSDKIEYVMADSEYNADDLRKMGYTCKIDVRPILVPFGDYKKNPDKKILEKYSGDGYTNILFVGRIAPNKKQEDIISAFAYYKKRVNPKSRLILAGSYAGMERYYRALQNYVEALMVDDVIFTGHTRFASVLAYYRLADVFLCMSEHEGFCVPLLEAMFFEKPIIAFDSCAVPYTLGGSGALIKDKDPVFVSLLINKIVNNARLREEIVAGQSERLKDLSYEKVRDAFVTQLKGFIKG